MSKHWKWSKLPLTDRLCYSVVALSTLWLLGVGFWEIAAPFGAGHVAVLPERAIMADNMVQFGILYPVRAYSVGVPSIGDSYSQHPWGTYYLFALVRLLFGRHEWAIRLVPVCLSAAMPSLLFFVANRLWGKVPGALSAVGWAVVPIALAFAQLPSFELFFVASSLGVTLAALRYRDKPSSGRLWVLLGVAFLAANTDWTASVYVLLAATTAVLLCVYWPLEHARQLEYSRQLELRRWLQGLIATALVVLGTLGLYVVLFRQIGRLDELFDSFEQRARGNELPLGEILSQRRYWIELMFTKVGLAVGVLGAVLMSLRLVWLRRSAELWPPLLLAVSTFHYVYFKNGADVHIYWPLPFAAQFCLSLGVIAASLEAALRRFGHERRPAWALGVTLVPALLILPDGIRALDYARDTGCRLNDDGRLNLQDHDKNLALSYFKQRIPPKQRVILHTSLFPNGSAEYALERSTTQLASTYAGSQTGVSVFDLRFAPPTVLAWSQSLAHEMVGPYLFINSHGSGANTAVQGFAEQRPGWFRRYFVQAHDPEYRLVADPYLTWETREHLAIDDNPVPPALDQPEHRVVAYNVAIAQKDEARAKTLLASIEQGLERRSARTYKGGLRLLGHRLLLGAPPRLEVYFLAAGPLFGDAFFDVRSRVIEAPRFSFVVADDKEKKYGTGFPLNPSLWKPGMLYVSRIEVRERPGRERFYGSWSGKARPVVQGGADEVPLFERP